jgi:hypothetical protein
MWFWEEIQEVLRRGDGELNPGCSFWSGRRRRWASRSASTDRKGGIRGCWRVCDAHERHRDFIK